MWNLEHLRLQAEEARRKELELAEEAERKRKIDLFLNNYEEKLRTTEQRLWESQQAHMNEYRERLAESEKLKAVQNCRIAELLESNKQKDKHIEQLENKVINLTAQVSEQSQKIEQQNQQIKELKGTIDEMKDLLNQVLARQQRQ